jgi:hypothetical protein
MSIVHEVLGLLEAIEIGSEDPDLSRFFGDEAPIDDCFSPLIFGVEAKKKDPKTGKTYLGHSNTKLEKTAARYGISPTNIAVFDLPAGWTCPNANICLAKADRKTGELLYGAEMQHVCYAASQEAGFAGAGDGSAIREKRWSNYDKLIAARSRAGMADLIRKSLKMLPNKIKLVRIHSSGDFFNKAYLGAWIDVARSMPQTLFYGYTKSVDKFIQMANQIPENLRVTMSLGGKRDKMIMKSGLKWVDVVFSKYEADNYVWYDKKGKKHVGLSIDKDDSHAFKDSKPFALLIHGHQPEGSVGAMAKTGSNQAKGIPFMRGDVAPKSQYQRKKWKQQLLQIRPATPSAVNEALEAIMRSDFGMRDQILEDYYIENFIR